MEMEKSLIGALKSLTSLQRWNFLPRVDVWTEAENIAYVAHVAYAIGNDSGLLAADTEHLMNRLILRSFNKHLLSDIPMPTRDILRTLKEDDDMWKKVVDDTVEKKTIKLFPRKIARDFSHYLTYAGSYKCDNKDLVESAMRFAQQKVALEECEANKQVYESEYKEIVDSIESKKNQINPEYLKQLNEAFSKLNPEYLLKVKRLKYLRRWNKINRSVESSVLSHTFVVAFLTLFFSKMCEEEIKTTSKHRDDEETKNFSYRAILRALFHDIPEALTGDIVTPVKAIIEEVAKGSLKKVEVKLTEEYKKCAPIHVQSEIHSFKLLAPLEPAGPFSVSSLVKDCDKLALVMECLFEKHSGNIVEEMTGAYHTYINDLLNSEWSYIREFCARVLLEFPFKNGK